MATYKGKLEQKTGTNTTDVLYPETSADQVTYTTSASQASISSVQDALDEIFVSGIGVTGVKGNSETAYRTGNVNLTAANIGAVASNSAITGATKTKITYDAKGLVTSGADLEATDIPTITLAKISDAGAAASKGVDVEIDENSTDDDVATAKAVYDAIAALPEPMIFKGSLGTGGTITSLPTASTANEGYTYKVITAGTYASQAAKVGDLFISNGTSWVLIPSGDEPSGTVTSVGMTVPTGLSVSGSPITTSGTLAVTFASGYSIPTTTKQSTWDAKQDALTTQTAYTTKGTSTKVPTITTNSLGQVTAITETDIAFPGSSTITLSGDVTGSGTTSIITELSVTGVSAGTYSAVTVDTKGRVTAGSQVFAVIANSGSTTDIATGGLIFRKNA